MTRDEYNETVKLHADGLYRFVLSDLRDADTAQDIVQDTFVKVWEKRKKIPFEKAKSYLYTTAYHALIDVVRKNDRLCCLTEATQPSDVVTTQCPDVQEVLHKALATLPEIQRRLILLRDYEGYSYEEIGEITGLNESQVKVYIFRGRTTLKKFLKDVGEVIDI